MANSTPRTPSQLSVAFAADHAGWELKDHLAQHLCACGYRIVDLGTSGPESVDYPDYGVAVGEAVASGAADLGVAVCGSGIGIAMAAGKVAGIRAATVHDPTSARLAREHNDAHVVCFGARLIDHEIAKAALDAFLGASYEGGRHEARVRKINDLGSASTHPRSASWAAPGDPEVEELLKAELQRQMTTLQLIASENFASPAVMSVTGSVFTNKYSEGYPRRRYYGGNLNADVAEQLAIDRVKALFGAEHANVQPHSGSQANAAVYLALLDVGDTVLGMSLDHGGHLTHGSPVNASGKFYNFVSYGLTNSDERINYEAMAEAACVHRPKLIVAGATAYPRRIDPVPFREVCDEIGAVFMFDAAHIAGLIVAGQHPNPVPLADIVTFTTHKTMRGPRGGTILCTQEYAKRIDSAVFPGTQGGPLDHAVAAKAVGFAEAAHPDFANYQERIVANASALADALAAHGFRLVTGGTDNHLLLVDLRTFDPDLTGKAAQEALDAAGITLNRNAIPDDSRSPFVTSGIRMGTASVTTQGMGPQEMTNIAEFTARVLRRADDQEVIAQVRSEVGELCAAFPPYER